MPLNCIRKLNGREIDTTDVAERVMRIKGKTFFFFPLPRLLFAWRWGELGLEMVLFTPYCMQLLVQRRIIREKLINPVLLCHMIIWTVEDIQSPE